jgi:hypothetical protein
MDVYIEVGVVLVLIVDIKRLNGENVKEVEENGN